MLKINCKTINENVIDGSISLLKSNFGLFSIVKCTLNTKDVLNK